MVKGRRPPHFGRLGQADPGRPRLSGLDPRRPSCTAPGLGLGVPSRHPLRPMRVGPEAVALGDEGTIAPPPPSRVTSHFARGASTRRPHLQYVAPGTMNPNRRSLPFPLNWQIVRVGTADYGGGAPDQGEVQPPASSYLSTQYLQMPSDQQLDCALDLMRRLPPQQIEKNLSDLIDLVPSLCEDLLSSVDQPLKIARDKVVGKDYLLCDYNRDGDSYRSPWSNKYDPPLEDGAMPSARLRKLEVEANNAFDQYRDLYFEGGVSSVYLWDLDHGFAGVILIKKAGDGSKKIKGCWDSIHVVEVQEKSSGRTAHYKLTSTVMLWLQTNKSGSGTMNLGGSLTRQMEKDETVSDSSPHIANIGRLVEDMENKIRSTLNEIYFGKTKDIVNGLRSVQTLADKSKQEALKNDLVEALKRKQQC
ncbi:F-actin-capping protein subunit beta [Suncus etruscus]|uniref:F-actin-capping protein subunit beta n=1 Tax=Suncus etruscus TaxID=109475 RepID=UPI0021101487|nr:F-actin-capping protein subunit beta [Suncus etruscus]